MSFSENENNAITPSVESEDEVIARLSDVSAQQTADLSSSVEESVPEAPAEIPVPAPAPEAASDPLPDPSLDSAPDLPPAEEAPVSAPVEHGARSFMPRAQEDAPQYGAPQPLFEDIIPVGFARDEKKRKEAEARAEKVAADAAAREAKEAEIARKKAEKEAAKEAKIKAKEDKKKAKTAALIAKVEAEAEAQAKKEIEKETGEPYELPATPEKEAAPVATESLPLPVVMEGSSENAEVPASAKEKPVAAEENPAQPAKRKYSSYERKLRKKYKLDKDPLLSENDAVPGFVIAKGENVIRCYNCLDAGSGDGVLCLTNKRLLINAGERSEIDISKVSGIKFSKYSVFSFFKFLFGLIFLGLGVFMLLLPAFNSGMYIPMITGENWKDWFSILFYVCGGVSVVISLPLLFTMVKKNFYFYVFAKEEAPFLEYKSKSYAKRERKGKVYKYMVSKAGKESEKAARELGALIIEAKEGRYDD